MAAGRAERVSATGWRQRLDDTRVLAVVLCVIWGLMFVIQRIALEVAPPLWVAAGRASLGALVLLAFAVSLRGLSRRGLVRALAAGAGLAGEVFAFAVTGARALLMASDFGFATDFFATAFLAGLGGAAGEARSFVNTRSVTSRFLSSATIGEFWSALKMNE